MSERIHSEVVVETKDTWEYVEKLEAEIRRLKRKQRAHIQSIREYQRCVEVTRSALELAVVERLRWQEKYENERKITENAK